MQKLASWGAILGSCIGFYDVDRKLKTNYFAHFIENTGICVLSIAMQPENAENLGLNCPAVVTC